MQFRSLGPDLKDDAAIGKPKIETNLKLHA